MKLDNTTWKDLHLLGFPGQDLFSLVDGCVTQKGREAMKSHWLSPPSDLDTLKEYQDCIRYWAESERGFPQRITNGTLVMIDQFYEAGEWISRRRSSLEIRLISGFRRLFSPGREDPQFFFISHFRDLIIGAEDFLSLPDQEHLPGLIRRELEHIRNALDHELIPAIRGLNSETGFKSLTEWSMSLRMGMKSRFEALIRSLAKLDAWISMGGACRERGWVFAEFSPLGEFTLEGLYHPLLPEPVTLDFPYWSRSHFVFLTGANMSGKTTLMRSLGVAVYLAHLGMGAPVRSMKLPFLDFMVSSMAVEDDLIRAESLFYAEVLRIKGLARQLNQGKRGLVLLDELFKGTNVGDAHACTAAIVDALADYNQHWILLSSHLFELAGEMAGDPRIRFAFMVTDILPDGDYRFRYKLKEGISQDQIGYQILVREGVLEDLRAGRDRGGC